MDTTDSPGLVVKIVVAAIIALIGWRWMHPCTTFAADGANPAWDAAVEESHNASQPAIVLFTAKWCGGCQWLHSQVLSRSDVQGEIQRHYTFLTIDLTNPSQAAIASEQKCDVNLIPTMIRYDASGKETSRTHALPPEQMIDWLRAGE